MKMISDLPEGKVNLRIKLRTKLVLPFSKEKFIQEMVVLEKRTDYGNDDKHVYLRYFDGKQIATMQMPKDRMMRVLNDDLSDYKMFLMSNGTIPRMSMTLGTDPEFFCEDKKGIVVPAFDFLQSKASGKTRTAPVANGGHPLYWDGFQAEFETQVGTCIAWQCDSIQAGLLGLYQNLIKHDKSAKISAKTIMNIPDKMLAEAKDEHVQFGCTPSKNIYGIKGKEGDGREVPFRSAGGHIHFGVRYGDNSKMKETEYEPMIKALDAIVGVGCVSLLANFDDPRRRIMYGLAGEYRTPSYGFEYRVLSNAWMFHPLIANIVLDMCRIVITFGHNGMLSLWDGNEKETIEVINKHDVKGAQKILKRNKTVMEGIIHSMYRQKNDIGPIYNVFMNGMESIIKDPSDIIGNWDLKGKWVTHCNSPTKNWGMAKQFVLKNEKVS